jgi:hypothetical protein
MTNYFRFSNQIITFAANKQFLIISIMSYDTMEKAYKMLTKEQQQFVYNLTVMLINHNAESQSKPRPKRTFGQFAGRAKAVFADDWGMSEEELCKI